MARGGEPGDDTRRPRTRPDDVDSLRLTVDRVEGRDCRRAGGRVSADERLCVEGGPERARRQDFLGRAGGVDATVREHDDLVAVPGSHVEVVDRRKRGAPVVDEFPNEFDGPDRVVHVETRGRLVEQQRWSSLCQRPGEQDALALSAGHRGDRPVREPGDARGLHRLSDRPLVLGSVAVEPPEVGRSTHLHDVTNLEVEREARLLWHARDPSAGLAGGQPRSEVTVELDLPGVSCDRPLDGSKDGRLPRAVRTDESDERAALHGQIDPGDDRNVAEGD